MYRSVLIMIIFSFVFICSCQPDLEEDEFQVYNEDGKLFKGNLNLVGIPYTLHRTLNPNNCPFKIQGNIKNGKINFNFSNGKIKLNSDYEITDSGEEIGILFIQKKNNSSLQIGLNNKDDRVDILFSSAEYTFSDDFDSFPAYNGQTIKAGWNFIEILENPDWYYGSDEGYFIIGHKSQNINDFYKLGYRWQIEYWN